MSRADMFPLGAAAELGVLERDPYRLLASLREHEPVSWLPVLDGWLVTRHDLALAVMRDPATFTVDDRRFSTARVLGPSMLSLDGAEHARHRTPFLAPFRAAAVQQRFADAAAAQAHALIDGFAAAGAVELRRTFAGPMAASIITRALGLGPAEVSSVLAWYDAIVTSVTQITAGAGPTPEGEHAFGRLRERLELVITEGGPTSLLAAASDSSLSPAQIVSNAAVLLFGGIETTEGMIANAMLHLLQRPEHVPAVRDDPRQLDAAIDESLRLDPAAAVIDRYATADTRLGGALVRRGELVRISIGAANRDPAVFEDPDRFDLVRANRRRHLAFAQGPHVCVGVHLARLEARAALRALLGELPDIRVDPGRPAVVRGLVFRKPPRLDVIWTPRATRRSPRSTSLP